MGYNHEFIEKGIYQIKPALVNELCLHSERKWSGIRDIFDDFSISLKLHIQSEDDILYQKAQDHAKANTRFYSLIAEHLQILEQLNKCNLALNTDDRNSFSNIFITLTELLEQHVHTEEALMNSDFSTLETSSQEIIQNLKKLHKHQKNR